MKLFTSFFLKFKRSLIVKRIFLLLNAAFAVAVLALISGVHLAPFVIGTPILLKNFTLSGCL